MSLIIMIAAGILAGEPVGPVSNPEASGAPLVVGPCPSFGDCFSAHGGPGCEDETCCAQVCSKDPKCCVFSWDSVCATEAQAICSLGPCPGSGSCFVTHPTPACNDASCCQTVCEEQPLCCALDWDSECVGLARDLCGAAPRCPAEGSCFANHDNPGCETRTCCEQVCDSIPACCSGAWNSACTNKAFDLCGNEECPGEGSCFTSRSTPGCIDPECCNRVCAADEDCCRFRWDNLCVNRADDICGPYCPDGPVLWDPAVGLVDARQPNPLHSIAAEQGIRVVIATAPPNAESQCWRICEPDMGPGANQIEQIIEQNGTYTLTLARAITPGAVTTIQYEPRGMPPEQATYNAHPGNVDGLAGVDMADWQNLLGCLNGDGGNCPWELYSIDLDRDGDIGLLDTMRLMELFVGAESFDPWFESPAQVPTNCP